MESDLLSFPSLAVSQSLNTINKFGQVNEGPVCPRDIIDLGNLFFEREERSSRTQGGVSGSDIRVIWGGGLLDWR
ncbi:MAG: hypothetical protein IPO45_14815 [Saprospiraceae bacterium]|uniref:hypothetical protein n=1 Tax=Candidatus Brachybacter algidus TaxID=2982024 RepID=UPI001B626F08|nr:hypothetical protein [Candidatus Brachybacter algidus]MBP9126457.1 hypothetical protein [Saprospiraceae bacterium]MBK6373808.1 hypothetical protein [Candidatus Brachybacter algidus]MBK6448982.1 hypothetical protein [Candidatus Brachybacter algidus]MBK8357348.1 hypothetical protein [Candidatus Brachybacter algidus]MBK8843525.1 hypothetical protein [Candidatus Brachybacter algidus]